MAVDLDNRQVATAVQLGRFAATMQRPVESCPFVGPSIAQATLRRVWLSAYLRKRPPKSGGIDYSDGQGDLAAPDAVTKELASFRAFKAKRRRAKAWRDFEFRAVDAVRAHRLNDAGRLAVRKAAGEIAVAGLAVRAADTGRVLMLQRALCDDDPAAGTLEFPGGHVEGGESPLQGAWREWAEETTIVPPPGALTGEWRNGIYAGFVWTVESESCVPITDGRGVIENPDDPDGDQVEALMWVDPAHLPGNPALRPELADSLDVVLPEVWRQPVGKAGDHPKAGAPNGARGRTATGSSTNGLRG